MKQRMVLRSSVRRLALLLTLFAGGASFPVRADQPCPAVEGQFSGPTAVFKSGQELPREGIFSLALQPAETVDYLSGSRRVKGDGGHGGVLTLRLVAAGRYRLFLSSPVDLELIQDYSPLPLGECRGEQASYVVSLGEGKVVLQVRGASVSLIDIAFLRI
jgi:hypothetical protein